MQTKFSVRTTARMQFVAITDEVRRAVRSSKISDGYCVIYVPHTTAGVTVNEGADPSVVEDIQATLAKLVPAGAGYRHLEGNADSHIKSTLVGSSVHLLVIDSDLVLGTWQSIFFCEFDGPRSRTVRVGVWGNTAS